MLSSNNHNINCYVFVLKNIHVGVILKYIPLFQYSTFPDKISVYLAVFDHITQKGNFIV